MQGSQLLPFLSYSGKTTGEGGKTILCHTHTQIRVKKAFLICKKGKTFKYRDWLRQHGPCYNTNTRLSFSNTRPGFLSSRLSFQFSVKYSKARPSVTKAQPHVLKQMLGWFFLSTDILRVFGICNNNNNNSNNNDNNKNTIYLTSKIYNSAVNQNKIIWFVNCSLHKSNNCSELVTKLQISAFSCENFHSV